MLETLLRDGKWDVINKLVKTNKIDVNKKIKNGNTLLHYACVAKNYGVINAILDKNQTLLHDENDKGDTCMHLLCDYGNDDEIIKKMLVTYPALRHIKNKNNQMVADLIKNNTSLQEWYIETFEDKDNNHKIILDLIDNFCNDEQETSESLNKLKTYLARVDINGKNYDPLLTHATLKNCVQAIAILLDMNADVNITNHDFETPLQIAIKLKNIDIVNMLLKNKANLNYSGQYNNFTPIIYALHKELNQIVKLLLLFECDLDCFDEFMDTPAHICFYYNSFDKSILDHILSKSNLNAKNIDKYSPLYFIVKKLNWHDYIHLIKQMPEIDLIEYTQDSIVKQLENRKELDEFIGLFGNKIVFKHKISHIRFNDFDDIKNNKNIFVTDINYFFFYAYIFLLKFNKLAMPHQSFDIEKYKHDVEQYKKKRDVTNDGFDSPFNVVLSLMQLSYELVPSIIIWHDDNHYIIHDRLDDLCEKLFVNPNVRYIIWPIFLLFELKSSIYHANILFYDKQTGIMERFDPLGNQKNNKVDMLDDLLDKKFKTIAQKCNLPFEFLKMDETLVALSFQSFSADNIWYNRSYYDPGGYCMAWCLFYVEHRILNGETSPRDLILKLYNDILFYAKNTDINPFIYYIRGFSKHLIENVNNLLLSLGTSENKLYENSFNVKFDDTFITNFANGINEIVIKQT